MIIAAQIAWWIFGALLISGSAAWANRELRMSEVLLGVFFGALWPCYLVVLFAKVIGDAIVWRAPR